MDQIYRINIRVGEVNLEIESTDRSWVEAKEKQYVDKILEKYKEHPLVTYKEPSKVKLTPVTGSMTLNEFYRKYMKGKVKSRPSLAVFFAYYLQKVAKNEDIKTQDIAECFAGIGYPSYNKINMTDVLLRAKKRAFLNYVNKLWSLTSTGEDYVLNIISSESE